MFDTLIVFLWGFFEKADFEKKSRGQKIMQIVPVVKEVKNKKSLNAQIN